MLDFGKNPSIILGARLAANVLGVLAGEMVGNANTTSGIPPHISSALALGMALLPFRVPLP